MSDSVEPPGGADLSGQIAELAALAVGLFDSGKLDEAESLLLAISKLSPANLVAPKYLGIISASREADADAIRRLESFVARKDDDAVAYNVLSVCHFRTENHRQALDFAERAIALAGAYQAAHNSRGNALGGLGRHEEALAAFQAALAITPDDPIALINIANALRALDRSSEALEVIDRAISIDPAIADSHYNRGNVLQDLGRRAEALQSYDAALALSPDNAVYHLNRCYLNLLRGDLMEGWREQEWRGLKPGSKAPPRKLPIPLWLGQEDLRGKSILLHCEQGLGDCIQFIRYAPVLARRGASVVIEAYHPLEGLFRTLEGVEHVYPRGSPVPVTDFHCPLMSLPLALEEAVVSVSQPYLFPPQGAIRSWEERLRAPRGGPRIGVVASGNTNHQNDRNRSIPLDRIAAHLPQGPHYVVLQKELRPDDREILKARRDLVFVGDDIESFTDTAAICAAMDIVISVDTSVAHLSGAVGRPTWILLPFDPDWRWGLDADQTDWYPSARLYRQLRRNDWSGALARVADDLKALLAG